jgi:hypothetical protein
MIEKSCFAVKNGKRGEKDDDTDYGAAAGNGMLL